MEKETFSPGQIVALLKTADRDWSGMVLFAYNAGARLSDAANLKWSNLDVANGIITYQEQKTGAKATIGLHPDFLDWLSEQPVPEHADAPVFPSLAGKAIGGTVGLSTEFTKLVAKAGIQNRLLRTGNSGKGRKVSALTFHSLRHSAATKVFNQAALKEIARRVTNHATGGSLNTYLHEDLTAIKEAVNLIPRLPR